MLKQDILQLASDGKSKEEILTLLHTHVPKDQIDAHDIAVSETLPHCSFLQAAALFGLTEAIDAALAHGANIDEPVPTTGDTALHLLCRIGKNDIRPDGYSDIIQLLLTRGANPKCLDGTGATPLHYAAYESDIAEIDAFLQHDPTLLDIQNRGKETTLQTLLASEYSHDFERKALYLLTKYTTVPEGLFHQAIINNYEQFVVQLLKRKANMLARDEELNTILHVIVMQNDVQSTPMLDTILKQAPIEIKEQLVNAQNQDGNTALHFAVGKKNATLIHMLHSNGAKYDIKNGAKETALSLCKSFEGGLAALGVDGSKSSGSPTRPSLLQPPSILSRKSTPGTLAAPDSTLTPPNPIPRGRRSSAPSAEEMAAGAASTADQAPDLSDAQKVGLRTDSRRADKRKSVSGQLSSLLTAASSVLKSSGDSTPVPGRTGTPPTAPVPPESREKSPPKLSSEGTSQPAITVTSASGEQSLTQRRGSPRAQLSASSTSSPRDGSSAATSEQGSTWQPVKISSAGGKKSIKKMGKAIKSFFQNHWWKVLLGLTLFLTAYAIGCAFYPPLLFGIPLVAKTSAMIVTWGLAATSPWLPAATAGFFAGVIVTGGLLIFGTVHAIKQIIQCITNPSQAKENKGSVDYASVAADDPSSDLQPPTVAATPSPAPTPVGSQEMSSQPDASHGHSSSMGFLSGLRGLFYRNAPSLTSVPWPSNGGMAAQAAPPAQDQSIKKNL
jgi:ankyrin repeat protein